MAGGNSQRCWWVAGLASHGFLLGFSLLQYLTLHGGHLEVGKCQRNQPMPYIALAEPRGRSQEQDLVPPTMPRPQSLITVLDTGRGQGRAEQSCRGVKCVPGICHQPPEHWLEQEGLGGHRNPTSTRPVPTAATPSRLGVTSASPLRACGQAGLLGG